MPEALEDARANGGDRRPHVGGLALGESSRIGANDIETSEDDEPEETVQRAIWDMSRDETDERLAIAQRSVFRAYMNDSITRGFERVDSKAAAALAKAEEILAKRAAEPDEIVDPAALLGERPKRTREAMPAIAKTPKGALCSCLHGDEHHENGRGACHYGHDFSKHGGCDCLKYRPRIEPGEKKRRHDERVDRLIRERQERLAARDAALVAALPPKETPPMPETSRIEDVFKLVESGVSRSAILADRLGVSRKTIGVDLNRLIQAGRSEHTGTTNSSRFYVKGRTPTEIKEAASADHAAPAKPRAKRGPPIGTVVDRRGKEISVAVGSVKVGDIAFAPPATGARFVVRVGELAVECSSAAEVLELARAFGSGSR